LSASVPMLPMKARAALPELI